MVWATAFGPASPQTLSCIMPQTNHLRASVLMAFDSSALGSGWSCGHATSDRVELYKYKLNPTAALRHLVDGLCVIGLSAATACAPCTHRKKRAWYTMSAPPTLTPVIFTPRSRRADLCRPRAAGTNEPLRPTMGTR